MTISTTQNRIEYNGNDLATSFAFPYPFLENTDIYVVLILASGVEDPQVLNTDYTLTGAGSGSGGTITMGTPPATGERLVIYREVPLTQETDYVSGDPFPAESHERALDKLTMITQQLTEQIGRTLQFAITTPSGFPNELPAPEASTIIGWDSGASSLQNYSLTGLGVSVNYAQWQTDEFSGDGSETEFVLTNDAGVASNISLSVGGVAQSPLSDFTYNATTKTITFNTAPPLATNNIVARYGQALAQTVPDIQDNTVVLEKLEQIPASTILGRDDSGNGNVQALTLGTGLSATGGVLSVAVGGGGLKNRIINPAFFVNQRAYTSGAATSGANQYTLDRWRVVTSGQSVSWSDSGGVRTVTAPAGGMEQVIEGNNLTTGNYVISWGGTATCTVGGVGYANGDTVAVTGGSNLTIRFSGGTVIAPQFELGTSATDFEWRPFGAELALCQRYYFRMSSTAATTPFAVGSHTASTTTAFFYIGLPVTMRAAPSSIEVSTAGLFSVLTTATRAVSAVGFGGSSTTITAVFTTHAADVAGAAARLVGDNGAYIGFDGAEI